MGLRQRQATRIAGGALALLMGLAACGESRPTPPQEQERNIRPGLRETPREEER